MLFEAGLTLLTLFILLYIYVTKNFNHWKNVGIPFIKGTFPAGSHIELITQSRHMHDVFRENYHKFRNQDFYGIYLFGKPVLVVQNMEMIRHVLVKDFNNFVNRNDSNLNSLFDGGEFDQFWAKQLIHLSGDEWKDVRSTFSPIFTSGKLKGMLMFMKEVGAVLKLELGKYADSGEDFEIKDVFGKFTLDSLASCAFGINPKSFENSSTAFVRNAARIFTSTSLDNLKAFSRFLPFSAKLQKRLNLNALKPKETKFFCDVIRSTVKHRRETGERRNDLIDLMIDCMKDASELESNNENVEDQYENDMKFEHKKRKIEIDDDVVVSTALNLLIAGYDTTALTLSFMGYFLSKHPDIQTKLQTEIDQVLEQGGVNLDYQDIQDLPYLEMCLLESLRHLTPIGAILRTCTTDYKFPNNNIAVKANDLIIIPAAGIHKDERYFPRPNQFNPENFSKESKQSRSPYAFLGFGQGPRACIGMRFALLEVKVAMIEVMANYSFVCSGKNLEPLEINPESIMGYVKGGLHARIERRRKH